MIIVSGSETISVSSTGTQLVDAWLWMWTKKGYHMIFNRVMYIACYGLLVAQRETEQMVVGGAIKELEWNWIDLVGAELMF